MTKVCVLLAVMLSASLSHPPMDSQRLFAIAVSRVQHLHTLAQRSFSEFSWEYPSRSLSVSSVLRNQISPKLAELKTGIHHMIRNQVASESDGEMLSSYGSEYQTMGIDGSLQRNYDLLACFKKDMHKVETYLTVAKCRLSPEDNCTL
ncbi:hypothetical protein CRUP_006293 [Coryphaenoides rupestris]|nr:hypothetical protein CRUP_006293 [Coryphaenoides rupestris]